MRRLVLTLAAAMLVVLGVGAPANAATCKAAIGDLNVQFNMGVIFGVGVAADPDTNVSYIGHVNFRGEDYTLVWFNVVPPTPANGQLVTAEERWAIYDTVDYGFGVVEVPDVGPVPGVLTEFTPGELLLAGSDQGYGTPSGRWRGSGPVTDAPAGDGPLGCVPEGSRVSWNGSYDTAEVGPGTHFLGKFRVFPTQG
jgi:hypothetical protein